MAAANHYELLGLTTQATGQELRQAFRSLSKLYHPDTTSLPPAQAEEAFRRVQQAYLTLSDPERRRAYDASLVPIATAPRPLLIERPLAVRRALSGGEWLALLLLALAVVFSLVLGVGLAWARGAEFMRVPSWLVSGQTAQQMVVAPSDDVLAAPEDAPLQPSAAPAGTLAA